MSIDFEGPSRRLEDKIFIGEAYKRAQGVIDQASIIPNDFADFYGSEVVEADKARISLLEEKFRRSQSPERAEAKTIATVFEAVFITQARKHRWFGANATIVKTSKFDDIINGVDFITEFKEEDSASHLGLVVDITLERELSEKFSRILEEIRSGKLSKVKYFKSDEMNIRRELSRVPRVIVTGDTKTIKELAYLWMGDKIPTHQEKLRNHFFQFQMLEEIAYQLEAFSAYAAQLGNEPLAVIYKKSLKLIRKVIREKRGPDPGLIDSGERDDALDNIKSMLRSLPK